MNTTHCKCKFYDSWATALGPVGAVAEAGRVVRLILPHGRVRQMLAALAGLYPRARRDPDTFGHLRDLTRAYFGGRKVDFADIPCILPPKNTFTGRVLRACRKVPYGRTVSYSALAARVGNARAARAVASAMARNPIPLVVPCHRVIRADRSLGGFSAEGGVDLKRRMLQLEGIQIAP